MQPPPQPTSRGKPHPEDFTPRHSSRLAATTSSGLGPVKRAPWHVMRKLGLDGLVQEEHAVNDEALSKHKEFFSKPLAQQQFGALAQLFHATATCRSAPLPSLGEAVMVAQPRPSPTALPVASHMWI